MLRAGAPIIGSGHAAAAPPSSVMNLLPLAVAEVAHAPREGIGKRIVIRRARARAWRQKTDAPNLASLLGARGERPRSRCAADERDELAPSCMSQKEHCEG
jgi:hypothetical protein